MIMPVQGRLSGRRPKLIRTGRLQRQNVQLAAQLNHPAALLVAEPDGRWLPFEPWDWPADVLPDRMWRRLAADFAERDLLRQRSAGQKPDPRSWEAVRVARLFADGEALRAELDAARVAAWGAWSENRPGAHSAAEAADWRVGRDAARCSAAARARLVMTPVLMRRIRPGGRMRMAFPTVKPFAASETMGSPPFARRM